MKKISLTSFLLTLVACVILPLAMTGCDTVDDDDGEAVAEQPPHYVEQAPPPDQIEIAPQLDRLTQVWRPGYWALLNNQFMWVPGKILSRPSPTAQWTPARWMHHEFGWSFEPGHWE